MKHNALVHIARGISYLLLPLGTIYFLTFILDAGAELNEYGSLLFVFTYLLPQLSIISLWFLAPIFVILFLHTRRSVDGSAIGKHIIEIRRPRVGNIASAILLVVVGAIPVVMLGILLHAMI